MTGYTVEGIEDPIEASSIRCYCCQSCPGVHVDLLDATGFCFATAILPISIGKAFVAQFNDAMDSAGRTHPAPEMRQ